MDIDNPQGTDEPQALSDDEAAARIQAILDPQEDNQGEDVDQPDTDDVDEPEDGATPDDGDKEDSEGDSPDGEGSQQTVKVKVDGQELELPIEEVAQGYQRLTDYRRKTEEIANQRKAMEAELAQTQKQYADIITQLGRHLEGQQVQKPDHAMAQHDPNGYAYQLALYQDHQEKTAALKQEQTRLAEEHKAMEQRRLAEHTERERQILAEKLPQWRDQKVRSAEQAKLKSYLNEVGVSDQEITDPYSVFQTDHRAILMAIDAMKYRELQRQKPKADAKTKGKPKVTKPGAQRSRDQGDEYRKAMGRLKKTGSTEDAAAAIKHLGL